MQQLFYISMYGCFYSVRVFRVSVIILGDPAAVILSKGKEEKSLFQFIITYCNLEIFESMMIAQLIQLYPFLD